MAACALSSHTQCHSTHKDTPMEQFTTSDGTPIHYVTLGQSETTLVFLHGWTANAHEWLPFAADLAEHTQTLCWDARGHGRHTYAEHTLMSLPRMADDLEELLTQLSITNAVLVGHSMGALTAWEYIRRHGQQRLAGLCIIDQSPRLVTDENWNHGVYSQFSAADNQRFLNHLADDFPQAVLELIAFGHNARSRRNFDNNSRGFQQMREYLSSLPAPLLTRCWDSITQQDYRAVLPTLQCPTLLIYGDESQFYSADLQQWVAQQIPHCELHIYPQSDHSPHLWHKDRFISDLQRFTEVL